MIAVFTYLVLLQDWFSISIRIYLRSLTLIHTLSRCYYEIIVNSQSVLALLTEYQSLKTGHLVFEFFFSRKVNSDIFIPFHVCKQSLKQLIIIIIDYTSNFPRLQTKLMKE